MIYNSRVITSFLLHKSFKHHITKQTRDNISAPSPRLENTKATDNAATLNPYIETAHLKA